MRIVPYVAQLAPLSLALYTAFACSPQLGDVTAEKSGVDDDSGKGSGGSTAGDGTIDVGDGTGSGGGSGSDNICQSYTAVSKPNPPAILLLLDQSGSMKAAEEGKTRWEVALSALDETVTALDDVADFGLIGFPTHPISSAADATQSCNAKLMAAPGPGTGSAIMTSITKSVPQEGHTPTRAALNLAYAELSKPAYSDKNKYVVVVTDGLPNCKGIDPSGPASQGYLANYEDPSDAVTTLSQAGVTTFVVGYRIDTLSNEWSEGVEHDPEIIANAMAKAGGTESYRSVSSGAELKQVLSDITASVAPCSFELDEPPKGGAEYVRVTIDDTDFALDDAWQLSGERTIELDEGGAACALLRDGGEHSINIQVECEPVIIR